MYRVEGAMRVKKNLNDMPHIHGGHNTNYLEDGSAELVYSGGVKQNI